MDHYRISILELSIRTNRLLLRSIHNEDVPHMKKWLANDSIYEYWSVSATKDSLELNQVFHSEKGAVNSFHWGIEVDGKIEGEIWAFIDKRDLSVKVAFRVSAEYQCKGIATESLDAIVRLCFEVFNARRIWADVFIYNKASIRVLDKVGFARSQTINRNEASTVNYTSYYIYEITK